ncbi:MAG: polymer-forming cytoskeletal protein [Hyphomicrobiaceae bacterium]|jgi:cytoskeletal protein CcmA (bactofilin family)
MFTKKPEKDGPVIDAAKPALTPHRPAVPQMSSARPAGRASSGTPSVIGTDLSITGNLESKGEIQIEGEVQGDIHAGRIVVGERARVTGSLLADDIVIRGNVGGSVRGNTVTLQSNSRVEGDLFHRSLSIEQGAFFEGKSRRSDDPTNLARPNGLPPPD